MWRRTQPACAAAWITATIALATACSSDPAPPDAPPPNREVIAPEVCGVGLTIFAAFLAADGVIAVCVPSASNHPAALVKLDEQTRETTVLVSPFALFPRRLIGNTLFAEVVGDSSELFAIRVDAGPTTPHLVTRSDGFREFVATPTHVYWSSARGVDEVLRRAPLSGGPEEPVASLPFSPNNLQLVDNGIYMIAYFVGGASNTAIARVALDTHEFQVIKTQPPGASLLSWFEGYRGRVLWHDNTAVPPVFFELHGTTFTSLPPLLSCLPQDGYAILAGSWIVRSCAGSARAFLDASDLETGVEYRYLFPRDEQIQPVLLGARDGWIYFWPRGTNTILRARPDPRSPE